MESFWTFSLGVYLFWGKFNDSNLGFELFISGVHVNLIVFSLSFFFFCEKGERGREGYFEFVVEAILDVCSQNYNSCVITVCSEGN